MGDGKTSTLLKGVAAHFNPSDADRLGIDEGEDLCGLRAIRDAKVRVATIRVYCDVELDGQGEPLEEATNVPTWTPTVPARPVEAPLVADAGHITVGLILAAAFFLGAIAATINGATSLSDWLIFAATVLVWRWIRRWAIIAGSENDEAAAHRREADEARAHARAYLAEAEDLTNMPAPEARMPYEGEINRAMDVMDARIAASGRAGTILEWDELDVAAVDLVSREDELNAAAIGVRNFLPHLEIDGATTTLGSVFAAALELGVILERLRWQPHLAGDREVQP